MTRQSIEFVPFGVLERYDVSSRVDFIIEQIKQDRILLLEMNMSPDERLLLMQRAMEQYDTDFIGIKLHELRIRTKYGGFIRQKKLESSLLLVAPGDAEIIQKEHGILSVGLTV